MAESEGVKRQEGLRGKKNHGFFSSTSSDRGIKNKAGSVRADERGVIPIYLTAKLAFYLQIHPFHKGAPSLSDPPQPPPSVNKISKEDQSQMCRGEDERITEEEEGKRYICVYRKGAVITRRPLTGIFRVKRSYAARPHRSASDLKAEDGKHSKYLYL